MNIDCKQVLEVGQPIFDGVFTAAQLAWMQARVEEPTFIGSVSEAVQLGATTIAALDVTVGVLQSGWTTDLTPLFPEWPRSRVGLPSRI